MRHLKNFVMLIPILKAAGCDPTGSKDLFSRLTAAFGDVFVSAAGMCDAGGKVLLAVADYPAFVAGGKLGKAAPLAPKYDFEEGGKGFVCLHCDYTVKTERTMRKHLAEKHGV